MRLTKSQNHPYQGTAEQSGGSCLVVAVAIAAVFLAAVVGYVGCSQAHAGLNEQFDATCKVSCPDGSCGTGCVFLSDASYVVVLTNHHVIAGQKMVGCEFWRQGYQSQSLTGQVYADDPLIDAAGIVIPTSAFGGHAPKAIPMGSASDAPPVGATIESVGCANGSWQTGWRGHVIQYNGDVMHFLPIPADGRSGSAICRDGKIVGLLGARQEDNGRPLYGMAIGIRTLRSRMAVAMHDAASRWTKEDAIALVQCGPGGCPSEDKFGGGRRRQQQQQGSPYQGGGGGGGSPWATLPIPAPASPPVDLTPLVNPLAAIANELANRQQPVAPVQVAAGPDPATMQAIQAIGGETQANKQAIGQLRDDVPKIIGAQLEPVTKSLKSFGDSMEEVRGAVKPLLKLREKLEDDAETGGLKGKIAQRLLDAGNGDDGLRKVLITAGIVLGLVFLGAIMVLHTMRTGKGPLGAITEKIAERHPDNQFLQDIAAKQAAIDAKIAGMGSHAASIAGGAIGGPLGAVIPDVTQRIRDMESRLHDLALATPPANSGSVQVNVPTPATKA